LVFVFPESWRAQEASWRQKMHEDFAALKKAWGAKLPLDVEPEVFFGPDGLCDLLSREDYRHEERDVMEFIAKDIGLSLYRVSPRYARLHGMPDCLPYAEPPTQPPSRQGLLNGLERLLAANDRLSAYGELLAALRKNADFQLPPAQS
jgi:hypothetical protein